MREAQLARVVGELRRELAVGQRAVASSGTRARTEVHLVDRHRRARAPACGRGASIHSGVAPLVVEVPDDRAGVRAASRGRTRTGRPCRPVAAVARPDVVLVHAPCPTPGTNPSQMPDDRRAARADGASGSQPLKSPIDRDALGVRRPDREVRAGGSPSARRVGAELLPEARVRALVEEVEVVRRQQGRSRAGPRTARGLRTSRPPFTETGTGGAFGRSSGAGSPRPGARRARRRRRG